VSVNLLLEMDTNTVLSHRHQPMKTPTNYLSVCNESAIGRFKT